MAERRAEALSFSRAAGQIATASKLIHILGDRLLSLFICVVSGSFTTSAAGPRPFRAGGSHLWQNPVPQY